MASRGPTFSLSLVVEFNHEVTSLEMAEELFRDALPQRHKNDAEEQVEDRAKNRAELWTAQELSGVYHLDPRAPEGLGLSHIQVLWPDRSEHFRLRPHEDEILTWTGFAFREGDVGPEASGPVIEHIRNCFLSVFDVLQPPWGCADLFPRIGFGTDTNPKDEIHWLNFYGPNNEAQARALAEELGVEVDERDWGGFVVQAWDDPFDPPEEHKPTPDPTTVQAPASPLDEKEADQYPRNGVLVAGVDPFEATTPDGETLAEVLAGEGAGVEDLAAHFHAARQAGEDFDPGELRLFPSFRHNATILGVPVADVPVTAETPPIERLDGDRLEEELQAAQAALGALGLDLDAEPELFLLICDTAGTEGI